jgi:hypothetical protein
MLAALVCECMIKATAASANMSATGEAFQERINFEEVVGVIRRVEEWREKTPVWGSSVTPTKSSLRKRRSVAREPTKGTCSFDETFPTLWS